MVRKSWRQADISLRGHEVSYFQTNSNDLMKGRTVNMIAVNTIQRGDTFLSVTPPPLAG